MAKIIGATCSLPRPLFDRFLKGRDVFVKFGGGRYRYLQDGQVLRFYVPEIKGIIGEGTISETFTADGRSIWEKYSDRIFLTKEEFGHYLKESPLGKRKWSSKKRSVMTGIVLTDVRKYAQPRTLGKRMTPGLHYLKE